MFTLIFFHVFDILIFKKNLQFFDSSEMCFVYGCMVKLWCHLSPADFGQVASLLVYLRPTITRNLTCRAGAIEYDL